MVAWQVVLIVLVAIPLLVLWGAVLVDLFRRTDLTGLQIATWVVLILIFPFVGAITYFLVRPEATVRRGRSQPNPKEPKRSKATKDKSTHQSPRRAGSTSVSSRRGR